MKKSYIRPETQLVLISSKNSLLKDPKIYGSGASVDRVAVTMDANGSSFEEDDDWSASSNKSLWDD